MRMIIRLIAVAITISCICFMSCKTKQSAEAPLDTISKQISNYNSSTDAVKVIDIINKAQSDSSYRPKIELVYENSDTLIEVIYSDSISIKFVDKLQHQVKTSSKELSSDKLHNLKQLIGCINPASCPFFYGDNIEEDSAFLIKIDGTIVLADLDASRSIVPYDLLQVYQFICLNLPTNIIAPYLYPQNLSQ